MQGKVIGSLNIKKYRMLDLLILGFIGVITELAGTWLINLFLPWVVPIFVSSIVILVTSIVRWGPIGLLLAPILALASFLGDKFLLTYSMDNQLPASYFVNLAFIACTAVIIPILIKKKADGLLETFGKRVGVSLLIYTLGSIVGGLIMGLYERNIFVSMGAIFVQQLMSLVVTVIFLDLLYRQETLVNVKERFMVQRKELEEEKKYYDSR